LQGAKLAASMNVGEPPTHAPILQPPFVLWGGSFGSGTMPGPFRHEGFWQSPSTSSGGVQPLELLAALLAAVLAALLAAALDALLPDVLLAVALPVVLLAVVIVPPLPAGLGVPPLPLPWLVEPPCPTLLAAPPVAAAPRYPP
jgi:hypothetical protein